jgi:hypothetical protein
MLRDNSNFFPTKIDLCLIFINIRSLMCVNSKFLVNCNLVPVPGASAENSTEKWAKF